MLSCRHKVIIWALGIFLTFANISSLFAIQQVDSAKVNSEEETIKLSNISVLSGEAMLKAQLTAESLIANEKVDELIVTNDSLLALADSLMNLDDAVDLSMKNLRYLENKLVFWQDIEGVLNNNKESLEAIVNDLDEQKYELAHDIIIWQNTKEKVNEQKSVVFIIQRIDVLLIRLDSVEGLIDSRTERLLFQLDEATRKDLKVKDFLGMIEATLMHKEETIFIQNQPPLWKIPFSSDKTWAIKSHLRYIKKVEGKELVDYFNRSIPYFIVELFLIMTLILLFYWIRKKMKYFEIDTQSPYQKILLKIINYPISAALVLGLFASIIILPHRPIMIKDISRILVAIPMLFILSKLVKPKLHKFIIIYFLLAVVQLFSFVFPPGHGYYVLSLLIIAIAEFYALYNLFIYAWQNPLKRKKLQKILLFFIGMHLLFVLAGFIGLLLGAGILAEVALNVSLINALAGILIVISTILINGLIEVGISSKTARKLNFIKSHGDIIKRKTTELLNLGAIVFMVLTVMRSIAIAEPILKGIESIFTTEVNLGYITFTAGGILSFFLVIWLSIVISNIVRIVLEKDILNKLNLSKGLPHTIAVLVRYSLITVGLLLAVSAAGMPLNSLTILFGAFGVGIGFGLQNIFNNLVSGLILLFERPIQIGDTIEVGQLMGNVKSIGIRSSNVRTFDGAEVIVPNGLLISNEVVNWTLSDKRRRIEIIAGVAYGSDPHRVKDLFDEVLQEHPDIIKDPKPMVFFNTLGESSLDFRLLFWSNSFDDWIRIKSEITFKVHDILKQEGIEIPFPQRDLHLRSIDDGIEIINKENKTKQ